MKKLATLRAPNSPRILQRTALDSPGNPARTGWRRDMAACTEFAGDVRARALYGHRTAALIARVVVLILALLLALVLTSQSRADDGSPDEPMLPFTIGGGLTVAALGALVLVVRRIQELRADK